MARAIRIEKTGGPEVMKFAEVELQKPDKGQALVRVEAAGVNFIDIYQRSGLYKLDLPFTLGQEGAGVIGTAGTAEKAQLARKAGANEVIEYRTADFEAEVKRLTDGKGVHVVYDSVGKDTFDKSLKSLRLRGMLVLFGASSGPVPP